MDSNSYNLNIGFPLIEGTRSFDRLKEILWPASYWTVLRKLT
jgi:hypothetical protein